MVINLKKAKLLQALENFIKIANDIEVAVNGFERYYEYNGIHRLLYVGDYVPLSDELFVSKMLFLFDSLDDYVDNVIITKSELKTVINNANENCVKLMVNRSFFKKIKRF